MNFYDQIRSPFEDEETIKELINIFSKRQDKLYYDITHNSRNEKIDANAYMEQFDANIFWPFTENDWKSYTPNEEERDTYSKFKSFEELWNYTDQFDSNIQKALSNYFHYSRSPEQAQYAQKSKRELQEISGKADEIIKATSLMKKILKSHTYHDEDIMGFHFDSQLHDKTPKRETPEVKFYINAGEDSYKVAKLFLDKCREQNMESYYFKVVDPMYKEQNRTDKLCIYSTVEHAKSFLEIIKQIQIENPNINFNKPPLTTGVIDNFIGFGTDTLDNDLSYNQTIAEVVEEGLREFFSKMNVEYSQAFEYIKQNPDMLKQIRQVLIQKSVDKGCSREKICVTDKLAERLKTVEINDTTERIGKVEHSKKTSSSVRKGPIQVYDENGNNIIHEFINPTLLKRKITLPTGNEISAKQFIIENFAPYIPENGSFKLKNGIEISARQYIEEFIMFELEKYNGDLDALMRETLAADDTPPERNPDDKGGQGLGLQQEQSSRIIKNEIASRVSREKASFKESLEADSTQNKKGKINSASFRESLATKRKENRTGQQDVKKSRNIIALRRERDRLSIGENLSEEQIKRLNEINAILTGNQQFEQQSKKQYNGMFR